MKQRLVSEGASPCGSRAGKGRACAVLITALKPLRPGHCLGRDTGDRVLKRWLESGSHHLTVCGLKKVTTWLLASVSPPTSAAWHKENAQ